MRQDFGTAYKDRERQESAQTHCEMDRGLVGSLLDTSFKLD